MRTMQWDIYKDVNKGMRYEVNKWNKIYTKMKRYAMRYIQSCKQMQWDICKDVNNAMRYMM